MLIVGDGNSLQVLIKEHVLCKSWQILSLSRRLLLQSEETSTDLSRKSCWWQACQPVNEARLKPFNSSPESSFKPSSLCLRALMHHDAPLSIWLDRTICHFQTAWNPSNRTPNVRPDHLSSCIWRSIHRHPKILLAKASLAAIVKVATDTCYTC